MSKGNVVLGVLAGVAVGALIGVLFAPDKGSETRKKITKKTSDSAEELKDKLETLLAGLSEKIESFKDEATELCGKVETEKTEKDAFQPDKVPQ